MWRRASDNEQGQAIVEFALVVPILLLLLVGIMEFGLAFSADLNLQNATREGARLAVTGATDAQITQRVINTASTLDPSKLTVSISPSARPQGTSVTVTSQYQFTYITPLISRFTGGALQTFTAKVTMTEE